MFRFLSLFYGRQTLRCRRSQHVSRLTSVQRLFSTLFTRDFPRSRLKISMTFYADFCPKTEDSFPNFFNGKWHFGANGIWPNHLIFPSPTIPSGHDSRVTWISFSVQQTAGHRVRGDDLHSYIILTASLSAC